MITRLLEGNRRFVAETFPQERELLVELASGEHARVLWIGCSDCGAPVSVVTGARAGEVLVHRTVANVVAASDPSLSAVLELAIDRLEIRDVVVCGHYRCGGVAALDEDEGDGEYIPRWLINAYMAKERVDEKLQALHVELPAEQRARLVVEENVRVQLEHLREHPVVRRALDAGRVTLHGWAYDEETGALSVLGE